MAQVIGSKFIAPYEFNVLVNRYPNGDLLISDIKRKTMFTITSCDTTFHRQRLLQDGNGKPIVTLRAKNRTAHDRWNVFRGQSKADSDMIFSVTTNDIIQSRYTHVNVSLGNKMSCSNDCDFQIKGSWSNRNCTIYMGNSSTILAQMRPWESADNNFMVTIYPNVDYAFVVAIIATVEAINSPGRAKLAAAEIANGVVVAVGAVAYNIAAGVAYGLLLS